MIDKLLANIEIEMRMIGELSECVERLSVAQGAEKEMLARASESLERGIKIINRSIPELLAQIPSTQILPLPNYFNQQSTSNQINVNLEVIPIRNSGEEVEITLPSSEKNNFLRELSISEQALRKLKRKPSEEIEKAEEYKSAIGYFKFSNKIFQNTAERWIKKGYFEYLSVSLRKANINVLLSTYVAMMILTTAVFTILSLFLSLGIIVFDFSLAPPFVSIAETIKGIDIALAVFIPLLTAPLVFILIYLYPSTEQGSITKKIDQDLPFAVMHMSAISGSGIEPTQIFRIIGLSKEYPALRKEIRKVINQINLYGYDLITALTNIAGTTPSSKLSELLTGVATTINSGGDLATFFEKRAETLLMNYRLEREKYTKLAETLMDLYITLVIAAPMILMIVLVLISVAKLNTGIGPTLMTLVIVLIIAILNTIFLGFLQMKQPNY